MKVTNQSTSKSFIYGSLLFQIQRIASISGHNPTFKIEEFLQIKNDRRENVIVLGMLVESFHQNIMEIDTFQSNIQSILDGCTHIQDELKKIKDDISEVSTNEMKICCICEARIQFGSELIRYSCGHKRHTDCKEELDGSQCSQCYWKSMEVSDDIFGTISKRQYEKWAFE